MMLSGEGGKSCYLCCDNRWESHTDNNPNAKFSFQAHPLTHKYHQN